MQHDKPKFEKEFRDYLLFSSLKNSRAGLWVTLLLFSLTSVISALFFRDQPASLYMQRFGILMPVIIFTLIAISFRRFYQFLPQAFFALTALTSLAVFLVGILSDYSQPGYQYYFAWTMLVLTGTITFYMIRFRYIMISGTLLVVAFTLALILNGTFSRDPFFFFCNVTFVIDIFSLGYFISIFRENLTKRIFMRDRELEDRNRDLKKEVRERRLAEIALKESQAQYLDLIDAIPDMLYVIDQDLRFVMINHAIKEAHTRFDIEREVAGKKITELYNFISPERVSEIRGVFDSGKEIITEGSLDILGQEYHVETRTIPVFSNRKVIRVMVIIRDLSRKHEIELLKQKNLDQKEILLREIHHRVKNNLAIVISLLDMQIRNQGGQNAEFVKMAGDIKSRIRSMALIHEHLYKSEELDRVPLDHYLMDIAYKVVRGCRNAQITLIDKLMPVDVKIETAMPIGLITNEIIMIACNCGAAGDNRKSLTLALNRKEDEPATFALVISDVGVSPSKEPDINDASSLGMFIIKLLVQQIEGELIIDNSQGISFTLIFKGLETINNK